MPGAFSFTFDHIFPSFIKNGTQKSGTQHILIYFFNLLFSTRLGLWGGVYAEIRQAHIVLLFFQYFADLSFLIILGGVCNGCGLLFAYISMGLCTGDVVYN